MAQITLNTKLTSESFTVNENDIIYLTPHYDLSGAVDGSNLTIIDTASVDIETKIIEETNATVIGLTDKLVQVTLSDNSTPYINISRIKDIITVNSYAQIRYDANGNVFQNLSTLMTTPQVLEAINTEQNDPLLYIALVSQTGTSAPTAQVLVNTLGATPTFSYVEAGSYTLTLTGVFDEDKCDYRITPNDNSLSRFLISLFSGTPNTFRIETKTNGGVASDEFLYKTPVYIAVYP